MTRQGRTRSLRIPLGHSAVTFDASWLVTVPAGIWAIGAIFVPIFGAFLSTTETWTLAIIIAVLSGASLMGHAWAHLWTTRAVGAEAPARIPLYPLADAAQIWSAPRTARQEALVALAGPVASLILAAVAYLLWNTQLHPYLNTVSLFLILFNVALAVINFTPVFPLDGGRLMRAIGWGLLVRPAATTRLARQLGFLYAALLMAWGIILIVQQARFSWQTGAGTCLLAALILLPLFVQPGWSWDRAEPARPPLWSIILVRAPISAILIIAMLGVAVAIVPTVSGLEAPGIAPPVDPMIEVPAEYRHPTTGQFLLTTVFSQTPITVGQWLVGQLSPVVRLVPPERIVPADTTIQDLARRNFRMLDDSQTSAVAVGLRLAGYETKIEGLGARVLSILPDSPASELLQPGDVIITVNGDSVGAVSELITRLRLYNPQDTVQLKLERNTRLVEAAVPLMAPSEPDQPPRIGISVEDAGVEVELPFPVEINPQKIVGGPSAGLMFTLTVYNMVTPEDLTGGRIIAGTGTINLDGSVGPIGGVQQKVAGAEFAGAEYFLSPAENYDDARTVARRITVVEVATAEEAIQFLRNLPAPD